MTDAPRDARSVEPCPLCDGLIPAASADPWQEVDRCIEQIAVFCQEWHQRFWTQDLRDAVDRARALADTAHQHACNAAYIKGVEVGQEVLAPMLATHRAEREALQRRIGQALSTIHTMRQERDQRDIVLAEQDQQIATLESQREDLQAK